MITTGDAAGSDARLSPAIANSHWVLSVVTEAFNPFREWLGLDLQAAQPNHYQLLDLPEFEADAGKIQAASDRALSRVRSHRPGAHAAAWAQLLDALAAAKRCLSDPAQKQAYDRALQNGMLPTSPTVAPLGPSDVQPANRLAAALAGDATTEPEIAPVNRMPDLFPPGMQPATHSTTRGPRPTASHATATDHDVVRDERVATPAEKQSAAAGPSPTPAHRQAKRPRPPIPPAPTAALSGSAGAAVVTGEPESSRGDVAEPVPPAPMNAHVAPPRRPQPSMLPIVLSIAVLLIVATMVIMLLAMRDQNGNSSTAPPASPHTSSSQLAAVAPESSHPFAEAKAGDYRSQPVVKPPAIQDGQYPAQPAADTQPRPDVASHPPPPADDGSPAAASSSPPGTPEPPGSLEDSVTAPSAPAEPPSSLPQPPAPASPAEDVSDQEPAPPSREELAQLGRMLRAARQSLNGHDFGQARRELASAADLAAIPQHRAMVERLSRLNQYAERFWKVVAEVVAGFHGGEELTLGSGELTAIVVDTGPRSITIRNQGRNSRYLLVDLPPGLALALAKRQLDGSQPEDALLLGACLAMVAHQKPTYAAEARKYWSDAAAAGARIDDLPLTLTDSYELVP